MEISKISNISISAIYSCIPELIINNVDFEKLSHFDNSIDVIKATGIKQRRFCSPNQTALDLSFVAAGELIKDLNLSIESVGAVVYVTFTQDHQLPGNSFFIHKKLNLNNDIPVFDISLACSGYPYGLWISGMIANNLKTNVLFLDGDKQSNLTDFSDKNTAFLFSDAGTATLIKYNENEFHENMFNFHTSTQDLESIIVKNGSKNDYKSNKNIEMDGFKVFQFVLSEVKRTLVNLQEFSGYDLSLIDYFVPHQANLYMIKQLSKKLSFDGDKLLTSLEYYGNTSSSSIPLTISHHSADIDFKNKILMISGFGAGLSVSNAIIKLSEDFKSKLVSVNEK